MRRGCTSMILSGRATFWKHLVVPNCQFVMQFCPRGKSRERVSTFQPWSLYGTFRPVNEKPRNVIATVASVAARYNIISALVPPLHLMRHQLKRHYNGANCKTWLVIIRNSGILYDIIIPRGRFIYNFVKIRLERVHLESLMGRQASGRRTPPLPVCARARASVCENFS